MGLYAKLVLLLAGLFLLGTAAVIAFIYVSESRQIEQAGLTRAETLNRATFEALYASMRQGGGRQGNRAVIERLRQIEDIAELRLVQGEPVARQFGMATDMQPQDELDRRALAGETVRAVEDTDGYRVVRYVTPLFVQPECQRCHQAQVGEVNGAISVRISLQTYDQALQRRRDVLLLSVAGGLLSLGLVTFFALRRLVLRPLQEVQRGAEALARGELSHRLDLSTGDEMEMLARAFNEMAGQLQEVYANLEEKVRERTHTLMALNAVLSATSTSLDIDEVYRAFAHEIGQVVDFDRSSIILISASGEEAQVVAAYTWNGTEMGRGWKGPIRNTGVEWMVKHRRARIDADIEALPDEWADKKRLLSEGIRSRILVPIVSRGEVIGILGFGSRRVNAYSEKDLERLTPIADQLAVALENARLYEAEKRRAAHLALLNEVGREVLVSLRVDELLRRVADAVWRRFGYYNVGILLLDQESGELVPRAMAGLAREVIPEDVQIPVGRGIMGHVAATGKTHLANDVTRDPYYYGLPGLETRAELCVPIRPPAPPKLGGTGGGGEVIGVLNVESRERGAFDEMDVRVMEILADQLAAALENARLYEETRRLAVTDPLTGLSNRRVFQERLGDELRRARRYNHPLSVIMADIDHFKHYNDTHGHLAGDEVLQALAGLLRANVRDTDLVARYGGEEFVVLLPETSREGALAVAEKIRAAVAAHAFPHRETQPGGCLTISLGVATFPEDLKEPAALIRHADKALYRAKALGRNQVCAGESL